MELLLVEQENVYINIVMLSIDTQKQTFKKNKKHVVLNDKCYKLLLKI